jgi:hypothetical protein
MPQGEIRGTGMGGESLPEVDYLHSSTIYDFLSYIPAVTFVSIGFVAKKTGF